MKDKVNNAKAFFVFAFYPLTTIIACIVLAIIVNGVLVLGITKVKSSSITYDVLFAIVTGVTASAIISIVIELSNNYKNNRLAWLELQEYYLTILSYEKDKNFKMGNNKFLRAEKKAIEDFIAEGGVIDDNNRRITMDEVQVVWNSLPVLIPVLKRTLDGKLACLTDREIKAIENIFEEYKIVKAGMEDIIRTIFFKDNNLIITDEEMSKKYSRIIYERMPEWMKQNIVKSEKEKLMKSMKDIFLSDPILLKSCIEEYNISKAIIKDFETQVEDLEDEEFDKMFTACIISESCQKIDNEIMKLEHNIMKKPYVGAKLKSERENALKKNTFDWSLYESKKRWLEKQYR